MIEKDTSRSAFPAIHGTNYDDGSFSQNHGDPGMTLRQYAAIHLKVPDSGTDWLDDMIRKAQRIEVATHAMQGILSGDYPFSHNQDAISSITRAAYVQTNSMLKASSA